MSSRKNNAVGNKKEDASSEMGAVYKALIETTDTGYVITDKEGRVVEANAEYIRLTGHSNLDEIYGRSVVEWTADYEKEKNAEAVAGCARDGYIRNLEIDYIDNHGKITSVEINATVVTRKGVSQIVALCRDITERKRTIKDLENARLAAKNVLEDLENEKENLARAKAKDEALLESIGEGVVAVDQDGKVVIVSKFTESLLGFTNQELVGKLFVNMAPLEDEEGNQVPEAERPIILALRSGKIITTVYYYVRKNGMRFPAVITTAPVLFNAKIEGAIIVFRDITKEKEIDKLRVDFLALASHQLRTPLSGTKWLIETIQRGILGPITPKQKEYFDDIYQINERMIKLVSEMLGVLMLESGTTVMEKQEILVSRLYEDVFLMMDPATRDKKIILRNMLKDNKTLFVQSNLQALRSILESFVSNAINYSRNEQEIFLDAREEPGAIIFSVKDSGIGIPKEEQKRIYERFYRASNAKEFKPGGTGLGVYTASLLAQKVDGKISFESEENKGTTFYLRIPKTVDSSDKLAAK